MEERAVATTQTPRKPSSPFRGVLERMHENYELMRELGRLDGEQVSEIVRDREGGVYEVTLRVLREAR